MLSTPVTVALGNSDAAPRAKRSVYSGWSLYWVSSDGDEDCFVVARNSRSAKRVDVEYCGFDSDEVEATRIKAIPEKMLRDWEKRRVGNTSRRPALPWYADNWLLRRLGASFRDREELSETLIDDVVYTNSPDGPVPPRSIGRKFLAEFGAVKAFKRYGHEDRYSPSQMTLLSILGVCVARVQEIEHLIVHSFIFSTVIESKRRKNLKIGESVKSWKRKTFGQMLRAIESGWDIEPTIHTSLQLFLDMRNQLVHGLRRTCSTTSIQVGGRTKQSDFYQRLNSFLDHFVKRS
jgi:hypothetical protein